jgi:amino-acid N-acetyltransferase
MDASLDLRQAGADDLQKVADLLRACGLPDDDVADHLVPGFVTAWRETGMVGVCGIEVHPPRGLLRSLAVAPVARGGGVGRLLVKNRLAWARSAGLDALFLLTTDADRYFERFGFRRIPRDEAPPAITGTRQYTSLCPATAVLMGLSLTTRTTRPAPSPVQPRSTSDQEA